MYLHLGKSLFGKAALATAALGGLLFFAGAPNARADHRDDGRHRNPRTEYRPYESNENHGYYNRQTNEWRHEAYERHDRFDSRGEHYRDGDRYQRRFDRDRD